MLGNKLYASFQCPYLINQSIRLQTINEEMNDNCHPRYIKYSKPEEFFIRDIPLASDTYC